MLRQLSIKNFAIVDSLQMEFGPGFNVLTGETGAGKSLIVDALYFLLGDRISAEALREGEDRAVVEALFQVAEKGPAAGKLAEWGIGAPQGEILVKREFSRSSGRTRSFLNGEMATASMISEAGDLLIDIHGQHEHQAVFNVGRHRVLVDAFGRLDSQLEGTGKACHRLEELLTQQSRLGGDSRDAARRMDLLQFQIREIEEARLEEMNEEELLARYRSLKHAEKIAGKLREAQGLLDGERGEGATGQLGAALSRLEEAARLDASLEPLLETAVSLQENLGRFSFDLSRKLEGYSFGEDEFQELSDRIDVLNTLKKKYGDSAPEILEYHRSIKEELASLAGREERLKSLSAEIEGASQAYGVEARGLSRKRLQAGQSLAAQVQGYLRELGLPHARMDVQVTPQGSPESPVMEGGKPMQISPLGWDRVEFLFSANAGEAPRPLAKVASGGEASRVMLALKTALAGSDDTPTLVFDEIDTGVGGRTAGEVAKLFQRLSKSKQILCVSHFAPIASLGDWHHQVLKLTREGRTLTRVHRLSEADRIEELARMMGGEPLSETSISHARELYAKMRGFM